MHIANAEEAVNPSNNHSSSQWSRLLDLKRNITNTYPTMAIISVSIAMISWITSFIFFLLHKNSHFYTRFIY